MNNLHRKKLLEEYEEISMELLMDEYAEVDGERLWREFEEAERRGEVPDVPDDLDQKLRKTIQASFAQRNRKNRLKYCMQSLRRVAVVALVLIGLSTTLVLSVDALRIPVLNFFLRNSERYTAIALDEQNKTMQREADNIQNRIAYLIPDEYELVCEDISEHGTLQLVFSDNINKIISLSVKPASGQLIIDTEAANVKNIKVNEQDALFAEKNGYHIVWMNPENGLSYDLFANALTSDQFWKIVSILAS